MSKSQSNLDEPRVQAAIKEWIEEGLTNANIVGFVGQHFGIVTSSDSIRRFRKRHGAQVPQVEQAFTRINGDSAEGLTSPSTSPILDDPDAMLKQRGLDPAEWTLEFVTANEYQGPASANHTEKTGETKVTYYQTKFTAKKIRPDIQLVAPRSDGWRPPRRANMDLSLNSLGKSKLVVIVGDQQAPFHDENLHRLFLGWLRYNQPTEGVTLGDSVDYPGDISRHTLTPENTASINECNQAVYDLFRGYVDASPGTAWTKLIGNHDERIRNFLLGKPENRALHGVKRVDSPDEQGEEVLSLAHLLRLDELGIKLVDPHGSYKLAQHNLSTKLAVRHGHIAKKGSGQSALGTLEQLGHSIIVGHTHRQALVHKTVTDIDGTPSTIVGVEAGCMCRISNQVGDDNRVFPDFAINPDWQQGFATARIWPDGKFRIELATYLNGVLLYGDQRYE